MSEREQIERLRAAAAATTCQNPHNSTDPSDLEFLAACKPDLIERLTAPRGEQTEAVARAVSEIIADLKLRGYANLSGDPDWCKEGRAWERIIARHPAGAEAPSVVGALRAVVTQAENAAYSLHQAGVSLDTADAVRAFEAIAKTGLAALSPQALGEGHGSSSPKSEDTHRAQETPVVGWQPIETAPRDGTHFLACQAANYRPGWGFDQQPPTVVHWFDDGFYTSVNEREPEQPFAAAFWMPLPPAPSTAGDE